MSNQSFVFNLKIKINENNEGEILYNNSSSKLKYAIFCYMNDKISCHTSLYNSYYNADIEVRKEEVTPITGVSATAFIKVKKLLFFHLVWDVLVWVYILMNYLKNIMLILLLELVRWVVILT